MISNQYDSFFVPVWSKDFLASATIDELTGTLSPGTLYKTIEFHNTSPYELFLYDQPIGGSPKVVIPSWTTKQFTANRSLYYIRVDSSYPANVNVSQLLINAQQVYAVLKQDIETPYILQLTTLTSSIVSGGTIDATITGTTTVEVSGGTVDIGTAPSITIASGTVDVTQAAGDTLNIGGTITVGNTDIAVTNASGGSLTVAGTIDIGNTPAVTVSSGTVAISSGSVNATIENATLDTQSTIINETLTTNPMVSMGVATTTITNLASNTALNINTSSLLNVGQFDQVYVRINSQNGYAQDYTLTLQNMSIAAYGLESEYNLTIQDGSSTFPWGPKNNTIGITGPLTFNPQLFSNIDLSVTSSVDVSSDVLTVEVYVRYASQMIVNPTSAPVNQQPNVGSYDTITLGSVNVTVANQQYALFTNANTFIKSAQITIAMNSDGSTIDGGYLYFVWGNGATPSGNISLYGISVGGSGADIQIQNSVYNFNLNFGDGVPAEDIQVYFAGTSLATSQYFEVTGFLITSTQNAPVTPTQGG